MAAVAPPADDAANLLTTLSLDSQTKSLKVSNPVKKLQPSVDSGKNHQPSNKAVTTPDFMDPTLAYYPSTAYYYGGYDGTANDWDDLAYGVYGYGFGYAPYGTYSSSGSPVPTVAQDGQLYGAQHYQYPSAYFQPPTPTGGPYVATVPPLKNETKPAITDQAPLASDTTKGSVGNGVGSKGNTGTAPVRSTPYQNSSFKANGSYGIGAQNGYDGVYSSMPWLNGIMSSDPQTRNNSVASRTQNHLMGPNSVSGMYTSAGYMSNMYPNKLYGQYGNTYRSGYGYGYGYGASTYDFQNNGRGCSTVDNKFKPRVRANGFFGYNNDYSDGLNELNRGPRSRLTKNQKPSTPLPIAVKAQSTALSPSDSIENNLKEVKEVNVTPDREKYNKAEFPETYADAKFFIIKSYSEDDVHKSIKYNVWASTQNGNKKLDAAYREAQQKSEGCPVFLFFSVNTSGQFVGVAEMVGAVDFNKILEYWQQDKWIGCFPVKWHIVKDIPNSLLKHIILEYNENKPVSNSRDTQEVKLVQGLQMIKIFKEHSSKQCILDDFEFYEDRQKKIQQKKAKQQFQKQSWQGKFVTDKKIEEGENEVSKSDNGSDLVNEVKLTNNLQDVAAKQEEEVVVNGVANAC